MKKANAILLVMLLVASAFTGGFFVGRNGNHSEVRLSQSVTTTTSTTAPTTTPSTASTTQPSTTTPTVNTPSPTIDNRININTATVEEFTLLPGIGPVLAQRIVDYRQANGPFKTIGQLTEVDGIGEKRLESMLDYVTLGGQS